MPVLNFYIKILNEPERFSIDNMVTSMIEVYMTAGVEINIISTETLNPEDPGLSLLNDIDTGDCMMGMPSDEHILLSDYRGEATDTDIVVFFCRTVTRNSGPLNGCATYPENKPMICVSAIASIYTLAHEVGHVLDLNHVYYDNNRLMTGNGTENITNPPPELITREINRILRSNLIH